MAAWQGHSQGQNDINFIVSAMLKWDSVSGNIVEIVFSGTILPLLNETYYEQI